MSQANTFQTILNNKVTDHDVILPIIAEHERQIRFSGFTADSAFELGSTIRSLFLERYGSAGDKGIVIAIELFNGHRLFSAVVGHSPAVAAGNWEWARGKSNTVRKTSKSSLRVGVELAKGGKQPENSMLPFPEYACHGGGFPVWIKGVDVAPIGVILVSGLPQLEDHQLIVDSIAKVSYLLADPSK